MPKALAIGKNIGEMGPEVVYGFKKHIVEWQEKVGQLRTPAEIEVKREGIRARMAAGGEMSHNLIEGMQAFAERRTADYESVAPNA
jgi:hypothetical protein